MSLKSTLATFRRIVALFVVSALMLITTACSQPTVTANPTVPDASEAAVDNAQSNLSGEKLDEDVLSQQGPSRARTGEAGAMPES